MKIFKAIAIVLAIFYPFNIYPLNCKQIKREKVSEGVEYFKINCVKNKKNISVHILKIDPFNYSLEIKPSLAWEKIGRLEKLTSLCKRKNAIAGVNGSFFSQVGEKKYPVGYLVLDGEIIFKSDIRRTSLGITTLREIIIGIFKPYIRVRIKNVDASFLIGGINRPRPYNGIILYNKYFGKTTETPPKGQEIVIKKGKSGEYFVSEIVENNAEIPEEGFVISFDKKCAFISDWFAPKTEVYLDVYLEEPWINVEHLLTGGPRLISNYKITVNSKEEGFKPSFSLPNSRTAAAVTSDNKLLLVVSEGSSKKGFTYYELAKLLLNLGAKDAMGLDSGGSSCMYVRGKIVNIPRDKKERPISNGILIFLKK
ncbi:MAG: phosphodiester glycosidase family protein [bacterium]|nr:phosphodiester glycosidase family protein [bacterium]MDW8163799.1 phosphodiester glycosidase family protein [Candidatus Omnitrophota bacterium]